MHFLIWTLFSTCVWVCLWPQITDIFRISFTYWFSDWEKNSWPCFNQIVCKAEEWQIWCFFFPLEYARAEGLFFGPADDYLSLLHDQFWANILLDIFYSLICTHCFHSHLYLVSWNLTKLAFMSPMQIKFALRNRKI